MYTLNDVFQQGNAYFLKVKIPSYFCVNKYACIYIHATAI